MKRNFTPDLTGQTFGRWKVLYRMESTIPEYMCECSCDQHTRKVVNGYNLYNGKTRSCGCLAREIASIHKYTPTELRLHKKWDSMKRRCYVPGSNQYEDYGGRGIYICDEWLNDREAFVKWSIEHGYKIGLSIDRYPDNDGPYAPWNCRYADTISQNNNRRSNHVITLDGVSKNIVQWKKDLGKYGNAFAAWIYTHDEDETEERLRYLLERVKADPDFGPKHRDTNAPVEFMGESHTIPEWAEKFGVNKAEIYNASRCRSYEAAVKLIYDRSRGIRHLPCIEVDGRKLTPSEWATVLHVNKHMLSNKLRAINNKSEYIRRLLSGKLSIFDRTPRDIGGATGTSTKLSRD